MNDRTQTLATWAAAFRDAKQPPLDLADRIELRLDEDEQIERRRRRAMLGAAVAVAAAALLWIFARTVATPSERTVEPEAAVYGALGDHGDGATPSDGERNRNAQGRAGARSDDAEPAQHDMQAAPRAVARDSAGGQRSDDGPDPRSGGSRAGGLGASDDGAHGAARSGASVGRDSTGRVRGGGGGAARRSEGASDDAQRSPSSGPSAQNNEAPPPLGGQRDEVSGTELGALRLLRRAELALRENPRAALRWLAEHKRRFPETATAVERSALRVLALCAAGEVGRGQAEQRAFLRAHPRSAYRERVERACSN